MCVCIRDNAHCVCTTDGPHQVTPPLVNELTARFWSAELIQEGQWRHLVVVLSRAGMLKYSNVTIYVDGNHAGTEKVCAFVFTSLVRSKAY